MKARWGKAAVLYQSAAQGSSGLLLPLMTHVQLLQAVWLQVRQAAGHSQ